MTPFVKEGIETEESHPYASCGATDVWKGRCNGKLVAIKPLMICLLQCEIGSGVVKDGGEGGPGDAEAKAGTVASYLFVLNLKDGCAR